MLNNMEVNNDSPKVFISYSWDDETHKNWVKDLADKLTNNGVHVFFDRYDLRAGKDLTHFMEFSVREANKVLLILTPNYKLKAEKRQGGVGAEYSMITAEIFNNLQSDKFIPIVRVGVRNVCTPAFVNSKINIDMSNDNKFGASFEELLRTIYNEHIVNRPNLGPKPQFDNKDISIGIAKTNIRQKEVEKIETSENLLIKTAYTNPSSAIQTEAARKLGHVLNPLFSFLC